MISSGDMFRTLSEKEAVEKTEGILVLRRKARGYKSTSTKQFQQKAEGEVAKGFLESVP